MASHSCEETTVIRSTTFPRILPSDRARRAVITASALMLLAAYPQAADQDRVVPPATPGDIAVPAGNRAYLIAHAVGTQNYICLPGSSGSLVWTLFGPQATLFNDEAKQVLTHFLSANPIEGGTARATWQHSRDTSAVWALAVAPSTDPAYVAPGAIPWLLLRVVGAQFGPDGGDKMTKTTFIHRVNTVAGMTPTPTCTQLGSRMLVPYEADYVFYRSTTN